MLIRIWSRSITKAWHREFRRQGHQMLNSFAVHFQAKEKKYQLKKMKKHLGEYDKPEKKPIIIDSIDEIPNIQYVKDKIKKAMEKIEKEYGPLRFNIEEPNDDNLLNAKVDINEEGYRALWLELLKDPEDIPKIAQVLQTSYDIGLSNMRAKEDEKRGRKTLKEKLKEMREKSKKSILGKKKDVLAALIEPEDKKIIEVCVEEMGKYLISRDMRRLDIGLIIGRPPILL